MSAAVIALPYLGCSDSVPAPSAQIDPSAEIENALLPSQSPDDAIIPSSGTPAYPIATGDEKIIWRSAWDNPVIQGPLRLDAAVQYANRQDFEWDFGYFDLKAEMTGIMTDPLLSEQVRERPWPAEEGFATEMLYWELHGMRLGPRRGAGEKEAVQTVQASRDDWNREEVLDGPVGLFQLKSDVLLVPIRVVVLNPPSGTPDWTSFVAGWFSENQARVLLDDLWVDAADASNDPGQDAFPNYVIGEWVEHDGAYSTLGAAIRPDRVFDVCEIQFRMIDYVTCTVPVNAFLNADGIADCDATQQAYTIAAALNDCVDGEMNPAVPEDGVTNLVFVGTLTDPSCAQGEVAGVASEFSRNVDISAKGASSYPYVVTHELGHRLGLPHLYEDNVESCEERLMCPGAEALGPHLTVAECALARSKAAELQSAYWPPMGANP